MIDEVWSAGFEILPQRALLAIWTALFLHRWAAIRGVGRTLGPLLASAGVCLAGLVLWNQFNSADPYAWGRGLWIAVALCACVQFFNELRAWIRPLSQQSVQFQGRSLLLVSVAAVLSATALCAEVHRGLLKFPEHNLLAMTHVVAVGILWGTTLASSLQLTFYTNQSNAPAESHEPKQGWPWRLLSGISFAALVAEIIVATVVVFSGGQQRLVDPAERIMPVVFGVTLILLGFLAWLVPYRADRLQRGIPAKQGAAQGWASLAMASWLAFLCFLVASLLPVSWPFRAM